MAQTEAVSPLAEGRPTRAEAFTGSQVDEFSAALKMLTRAAESLDATATQLMNTMRNAHAAPPGAQQISTWDDDPYSEAIPSANPPIATPFSVNIPTNDNPLLQIQVRGPQPPPALYSPGTQNFRYWVTTEGATRAINLWSSVLPQGTRWSVPNPMQVTLDAGQDLNAFYSRGDGGLFFFHQTVKNRTVFASDSPDVVCHETGHAILDAFKPQLFDAASAEVAAFHESFGDMSSILSALQFPSERQKVLNETQGDLNVSSQLSRLAEQLGWAIRQLAPTAVDADCLRNAANRFFYRRPAQLPPDAPASQLSSEPHSFSRVFTGAFLDAIAGMLPLTGPANDANLLAVSHAMAQLLVDGIYTAPIGPGYYSQVAAGMIQADEARNQGRYKAALINAFVRHGIISLEGIGALASAPVPRQQVVPLDIDLAGAAGARLGTKSVLAYDGHTDDAYRRGSNDTPALPLHQVPTSFGVPLLVHYADERERFSVRPATLTGGPSPIPAPEEGAMDFVEDLMQLGKIDFRAAEKSVPPALVAISETVSRKTHVVQETPQGLVLKRLHFDCRSVNGR